MKKTFLFISTLAILNSCISESKPIVKSPTIYGVEYCECMIKNKMDDKSCYQIIEENKEVHGEKNTEAEEEFKNAAISCMRNKGGVN